MKRIMIRSGQVLALAAVAAALAATACAGGPREDKVGGTTSPTVLRMANGSSDLGYEPAVAYFVKRVGQLSHGVVRIDVVSDWGHYKHGFEQQIVTDVAADKADLAWVGTRVFDTLGDPSFQALTAPMLIDSYPLERAVIASEIPSQMLDGLDKLNVTGLAVLADGLRKPIAVKGPLLGPADWRGISFAAFRSRSAAQTIRALGARPSEAFSSELLDDLDTGVVQGFEKNLLIYHINGMEQAAPYVTANVNLWPQTVALFANSHMLSTLSNEQRTWLQQAAADAADRSTSLVDHDARTAAAVCKNGARLANASTVDLAAMRQALQPVYARIEHDPQTRAFIQQIERLKSSTPAGPALRIPAGCAAPVRTTSKVVETKRAGIPDGIYRANITEAFLRAAGVGSRDAFDNSGIQTLIFKGTRWTNKTMSKHHPPDCSGDLSYSGKRVSLSADRGPQCGGAAGGLLFSARWSYEHGELRFAAIRPNTVFNRAAWGVKPWKKIG